MFLTFFKWFIIGWVVFGIYQFLIKPYLQKKYEKRKKAYNDLMDAFGEALNESIDETRKLRSDETPSDADILLYYKMFCKKWEMDNRDTWTTLEPMSFDVWERYVKEGNGSSKGWQYMIAKTSDAFMSGADGHSFMRYNDYKKMVQNDDQQFLNDVEQAAEELET